MIFIFTSIFLIESLTLCNSRIINYSSDTATHFVILSEIKFDYYAGLWVDFLPSEILEKHASICEILRNPMIILDDLRIPVGLDTMYSKFEGNYSEIPALNSRDTHYEPNVYGILVNKNDHLLHLLPCHRANGKGEEQTVYITKLIQYKSLIMLANRWPISNIEKFDILGFIMKFVNIELIKSNATELFKNAFKNLIQYEKKGKTNENFNEILSPQFNDLNLEYRNTLWRLCASVIQKSSINIEITTRFHVNVEYIRRDFSFVFNEPSESKKSKIPTLRLKVIKCTTVKDPYDNVPLMYYLIKHSSHQLYVIYVRNDEKTVELFDVSDEEAIDFIDFAFNYIYK